jgi:hypothetical protein
VGCYSSSPLKQNLVPRFLSVVVRGVETKLELGLNGCSSNSLVIIWVASRTCFCWRWRLSSFLKLMAEELMLPEVSCRNLFETLLGLAGLGYLVCPKRILRELESFQLANWGLEESRLLEQLLLSWGCCSLHVYWQSLWFLVLHLEAWCWCRPLISSLQSSKDGRQEQLNLDRHVKSVDLVLYAS